MTASPIATNRIDAPLSGDELDELQALLSQPALGGRAMDLSMLQGYAAALISGPELVMPSEWLAWVWDAEQGEAEPGFESEEQANRILQLVMRHYNGVAEALMTDPEGFVPLFRQDSCWSSRRWCEGFLQGMDFAEEQWLDLQSQQFAWFTPFVMLGGDEELLGVELESDYIPRWEAAVAPSLARMHAHWLQQRTRQPRPAPQRRETPKTGRNDPCTCGSGLKFKKCCGAASTLH